MLTLVVFTVIFIFASLSHGSAAAGLAVAANIAIWIAGIASIVDVVLGMILVGWAGVRGGAEDFVKMLIGVVVALILWNGLGVLAIFLIGLGGTWWIIFGAVCWFISIVAEMGATVAWNRIRD